MRNKSIDSNQFQRVVTNDTIVPQNGFEYVSPITWTWTHDDYLFVWNSVQTLVKVRESLQSNPQQTVKIFLYTSGDQGGYSRDYWVIYLKQ
jgi:hypothetical protein